MSRLKIVVLGEGGVGKSSLTLRFIVDKFIEDYDPTIEDHYIKKVLVDGYYSEVDIADTAGQEEYYTIRNNSAQNADGIILVYSITSLNSFEEAIGIIEEIIIIKEKKIPVILVGNKSDLRKEREVPDTYGKKIEEKYKFIFYETSAKYNVYADEIFFEIIREIRKEKNKNNEKIERKEKKKSCIIL
jgi:small GTP-binding protein